MTAVLTPEITQRIKAATDEAFAAWKSMKLVDLRILWKGVEAAICDFFEDHAIDLDQALLASDDVISARLQELGCRTWRPKRRARGTKP